MRIKFKKSLETLSPSLISKRIREEIEKELNNSITRIKALLNNIEDSLILTNTEFNLDDLLLILAIDETVTKKEFTIEEVFTLLTSLEDFENDIGETK